MGDAPERITYFHDGDILQNSFSAPHQLSNFPRTEYVPADLSDANDARIAELEAEHLEVRIDRDKWFGAALDNKHRITELEALNAELVEALSLIHNAPCEMIWGENEEVRDCLNKCEGIAIAALAKAKATQ